MLCEKVKAFLFCLVQLSTQIIKIIICCVSVLFLFCELLDSRYILLFTYLSKIQQWPFHRDTLNFSLPMDVYLDLTLIPGYMLIKLTGANYDLDACGTFPFNGNRGCSFTQFMRSFLQPAPSLIFFSSQLVFNSWYSRDYC